MEVRLKDGLMVVIADPAEAATATDWVSGHDGHVFALRRQDARTLLLADLGPRASACREPINVISTSADPAVRLISNLANTSFELHGRTYASVEAFWQGLKFPDGADRACIASLHGPQAKAAGNGAPAAVTVAYEGREYRVGCCEHWSLMKAACRAKFAQHADARAALIGTGDRPLVHRVRRDSRTIPGVIMAEIWMQIRTRLTRDAAREPTPGLGAVERRRG